MFRYLKFLVTMSASTLLFVLLSACSNPKIQIQTEALPSHARLISGAAVMPDDYVLPMKTWSSVGASTAVVLALHGFNDYSNAFDAVAIRFAENLITTYAIDQRGFGATEQRGIWPGHAIMQSDLVMTVNLLCEKHAGQPLYLLGESMGAAVILSTMQQLQPTCVQGVMLMAPAVLGWQVMPWWQTLPLRLLAHTMPDVTVTGEGLEIRPSDNDEILRALGRDPLIIKETRIDAIYGLTDLMEAALVNSGALTMPALILYGEHDEIISAESFCEMVDNLPDRATSQWRLMLYPDGYHMLSRDLQAEVVIQDIVVWLRDQSSRLPSDQEVVQGSNRLLLLNECDWL